MHKLKARLLLARRKGRERLARLRLRLARADALLPLSVMGLLTGLLAGAVILLFRASIEWGQTALLPGGDAENYEGLPPLLRFVLATGGALLIGLLWQALSKEGRSVGVVHVIERLAAHQGQLPLKNAVLQFIGGALSLISGHSVGREGPGVHLGAACGSQLGRVLHLPHTYLRTLVACGVAAAIAASFNTPLAGVIFAMEVVLLEYTVAGFAPVMLAAVSATVLVHTFYGAEPAFTIPALPGNVLADMPLVLLLGIVMGALAAMFIKLLHFFSTSAPGLPLWSRMTLGGAVTGLCAFAAPQVMGIGYDTINASLLGELSLGLLLLIVAFKLIATTAAIGLGLPGGLIGPTFIIGALGGGALAALAALISPEAAASTAFYVVIGMGAMMAATLQAPLAALMAILELTHAPGIILPGMLAVIAASLTSNKLFGNDAVFLGLLQRRGLNYRTDPLAASLRNIGVASAMNTRIALCPPRLSPQKARALLADNPQWLVIQAPQQSWLMPAADLARHLQAVDAESMEAIPLLDIPAARQSLSNIDVSATLQEGLEQLQRAQTDALCVTQVIGPLAARSYGIITRQDIEASYQYRPRDQ